MERETNNTSTDPDHAAFPSKTVPVESRGGNDMASGAENWGDIESRITDERAMHGEMSTKPKSSKSWFERIVAKIKNFLPLGRHTAANRA